MTTKGFRFTPNESGIHEVTTGPDVGKLLNQYADDAARNIRRLAPRRRSFMDYRKNIKVNRARKVGNTVRAEVVVDSPLWHLPEYGTSRLAPSAPIRTGVRATGIKFEEQ